MGVMMGQGIWNRRLGRVVLGAVERGRRQVIHDRRKALYLGRLQLGLVMHPCPLHEIHDDEMHEPLQFDDVLVGRYVARVRYQQLLCVRNEVIKFWWRS